MKIPPKKKAPKKAKNPQDRSIGGFEPIWIERRSKSNPNDVVRLNIFAMTHPEWRYYCFDMFIQIENAIKKCVNDIGQMSRQLNLVMERAFMPELDEFSLYGDDLRFVLDGLKAQLDGLKEDDENYLTVKNLVVQIDTAMERAAEIRRARSQMAEMTRPRKKPQKPQEEEKGNE